MTPTIGRRVLSAAVVSAPAWYVAVVILFIDPGAGAIPWVAAGLMALMGVAAGILCAGLTPDPRREPAGANVPWPILGRAAIAWCGRLCHWIVPSIWLFLLANHISSVVHVFWWGIPTGCLKVVIPVAAAAAVFFSWAPSRWAGLLLPLIAILQLAVAGAFVTMCFVHPPQRTAAPAGQPAVTYVLDSSGEIARSEPATTAPALSDRGMNVYSDPGDGAGSGQSPVSRIVTVYDTAAPSPAPLAQRFADASGGMILLSLAVFQFIAAMGRGAQVKRPGVRCAAWVLLLVLQCMAMWAARRFFVAAARDYRIAAPESMPVGDVLQFLGSWAFGSAEAGLWLWIFQMTMLVLMLAGSAWISLNDRAGITWACSDATTLEATRGARWFPRRREFLHGIVCASLCSLGAWCYADVTGRWQAWSPSIGLGWEWPVPDLISTFFVTVFLAVILMSLLICLLRRFVGHPPTRASRAMTTVVIICGLTCLGPALAVPFCSDRYPTELVCALGLLAGWLIVHHLSTRRAMLREHRNAAGLCLCCGYDLRGTPQRCPECGAPTP